jgi:phosphoglycerol transferase MdoB-like AlkP superfamily enzyme
MGKNISIVVRYFLFWLLFFFLERLIFILSFTEKLKGLGFLEISKSFIIGLWMDSSMTAYISVLPLLTALVIWFFPSIKLSPKILNWYTAVLVVAFSIICAFNFNIYREWGSKINFKALEMGFSSPGEAIASGSSSPILASVFALAILISLGLWLAKNIISYKSLKGGSLAAKSLVSVLLIGITFLAIRGGWQLSPINESMAYYSNTQVLNHAAINTEWGLLKDILNNKSTQNPYQYFKTDEANKIVAKLYAKSKNPTTEILHTTRPNVVFVIMESFTADVVESLGGDKGVAPQMEKLRTEGLLFDQIYASGDRTDKGVVAVLTAFPSQATKSIMKYNSKQEKLPSISANLINTAIKPGSFMAARANFST